MAGAIALALAAITTALGLQVAIDLGAAALTIRSVSSVALTAPVCKGPFESAYFRTNVYDKVLRGDQKAHDWRSPKHLSA